MKTVRLLLVPLACLLWIRPVLAQSPPPDQKAASWHAEDFYVEVTREPNGKPLLMIHYPWKTHARPSVEVRQLAAGESDDGEIRPLGFVANVMKGEVTAAVYQCRDLARETPVVRKLKHEGQDYELVGSKNGLGSGSVCAVFAPKPDAKKPAALVAFPLLESWAVDERTLALELPESSFASPGRIRVWFLRTGDIVWWKTVNWPGAGKGR